MAGNLTPGSSKGCKTLHSCPYSSGISSGNTSIADRVLSFKLAFSLVGSLIYPSVICCIQVLGLQVAVAVGWDGDPSGRITLGLLVFIGSTSGTTGVVMTAEADIPGTSMSSLPQTSDDTSKDLLVELFLFLSSTVAKNCQVDTNTSSLLASLVL